MTEQILKTPLEIRGLEFSPENIQTLKLAEELVRSLSISMGRTDDETVPIRVDRDGSQWVREFDRTNCACKLGIELGETVEVDLGDIYNYMEGIYHLGVGFVSIGIKSGVYTHYIWPSTIAAGGIVATPLHTGTIRFYGKFRYFMHTIMIGDAAGTLSYSAYKFPGR